MKDLPVPFKVTKILSGTSSLYVFCSCRFLATNGISKLTVYVSSLLIKNQNTKAITKEYAILLNLVVLIVNI